jgi:predicted component of type VI protein secretion system
VKTTEIKLRLPAVIGRGKGSTITLLQPLVSRQHCELFEANGKLWVRDLGSLNGTYVNNEKVSECEVPPNELLTVGTVTFRAIYEPLAVSAASSVPVPQFLPSKAREEDEQPTIRVDSATNGEEIAVEEIAAEEIAAADEVVVEEIEEFAPADDDDEGVPSTPLFASEPAKPVKPAPARAAPARPAPAPAAPARPTPMPIPTAVTTDASTPKSAPAPPADSKSDAADDDDDLNDFLKSLGKK